MSAHIYKLFSKNILLISPNYKAFAVMSSKYKLNLQKVTLQQVVNLDNKTWCIGPANNMKCGY